MLTETLDRTQIYRVYSGTVSRTKSTTNVTHSFKEITLAGHK